MIKMNETDKKYIIQSIENDVFISYFLEKRLINSIENDYMLSIKDKDYLTIIIKHNYSLFDEFRNMLIEKINERNE